MFIRNLKINLMGGAAFLGLFFVPVSGVPTALAAQDLSNETIVENPGILPTNPFYFIKSWRRTAQRTVTLNSIKKAELELDILNEKLAEINRLYDVLDGGSEALRDAARLYNESIDRFQSYVNGIKDNSKNSQVDRFLNKALEIAVKNYAIFNSLESRSDLRIRESLERSQDKLVETLANVFSRLDIQDNFQNRLEKLISKQESLVQLLTAGEFLNDLDGKITPDSYLKDILFQIKENILMEIQAVLEAAQTDGGLADILESLAGSRARQIMIFDDLRDLIVDPDLKNELSIVRQSLLDLAKEEKSISKPVAEAAIRQAREAIQLLEEKIKKANVKSNSLNVLMARAKFNLTQSETSFEAGQYGEAFGQATASLAAAKNALGQIGDFSIEQELKKLKSRYDGLFGIARESGLTAEQFPDLFNLLSAAEKSLVKVSDLALGKKYSFDKVGQAFREAKLFVARADWFLKDLLKRLQEKTEFKKSGQPLIQRVLPVSAEKEKEIRKEAIEEIKKKEDNR